MIAATHYFADCSMSNFWSSFKIANLDSDFARIRGDGFTHIILIVPWAQFHERLDDMELSATYVARLNAILDAALRQSMQVILRVGFLWENAPVRQRTYERFRQLPFSKKHQKCWKRFTGLVKELMTEHENFAFAFISWEDFFWPIYKNYSRQPEDERQELAELINYTDFSAPDLPRVIPEEAGPGAAGFFEFFDRIILEYIYALASEGFPGIEYEYRSDASPFKTSRGVNFMPSIPIRKGGSFPIGYFHPNLGASTKSLDIDTAFSNLMMLLQSASRIGIAHNSLFIDQFNFVTDNPEFPHFAKIEANALRPFLEKSLEAIRHFGSGFGVWGYRDWVNDKLYNAGFELGLDGWDVIGNGIEDVSGGVRLRPGGRIAQSIFQSLGPRSTVQIWFECPKGAKVSLHFDGESAGDVEISAGRGLRDFEIKPGFGIQRQFEFGVTEGELTLTKVALFDHVFSSGLYTRNFEKRVGIEAISNFLTKTSLAGAQDRD